MCWLDYLFLIQTGRTKIRKLNRLKGDMISRILSYIPVGCFDDIGRS